MGAWRGMAWSASSGEACSLACFSPFQGQLLLGLERMEASLQAINPFWPIAVFSVMKRGAGAVKRRSEKKSGGGGTEKKKKKKKGGKGKKERNIKKGKNRKGTKSRGEKGKGKLKKGKK